MKPMLANPKSIIAQVDGSGTPLEMVHEEPTQPIVAPEISIGIDIGTVNFRDPRLWRNTAQRAAVVSQRRFCCGINDFSIRLSCFNATELALQSSPTGS
jgi:hypothetical protein